MYVVLFEVSKYFKVNQISFEIVGAVLVMLNITAVLRSNFHHAEMCSGSKEGSYLRLIDLCITQLWAGE